MRKKKWNAGFSMVELLLAVAILATLCGFGFVSVVQQRKNLAIMEANETAKEIFLAAQEHLSMAALQGRLHSSKDSGDLLGLSIQGMEEDALGVKVKDSEGNAVSYAIFDEKSVPDNDDPAAETLSYSSSASEVMLPDGSVDAFVLNHRYAVRYNADAYRTLEVFYTQNDYRFERGVWAELQTWVEGRKQVQENPGSFRVRNESPVVMGWYGETALLYSDSDDLNFENENLEKPSNPQGIKPGLTLVNGPVLYAVVALDTENYSYSNVNLKIEGLNSVGDPASASIPLSFDSAGNFIPSDRVRPLTKEDGVSYYMVILDDVTVSGLGFSDIFKDTNIAHSSEIVPGSNIRVTAETQGSEVTKDEDGLTTVNPTILTANSETKECNSLFANESKPDDAHITNFRHLQNLSNLDAQSGDIVKATLDQSVYFNSFKNTIQETHSKYSPDKADKTVLYTPVRAEYKLNFEGGNHIIGNLEIDTADKFGNAGVFGTLNGGAGIQNVRLENTTFNFKDGVTPKAAGTLIGFGGGATKELKVENVVSHTSASVTATDYAGGLIGRAEGAVTLRNAASYSSKQGEPGSVTATGVGGVAGGLIGVILDKSGADKSSTVENCAAANKVTAENNDSGVAGGLVGKASGNVGVKLSYAGGVTVDGGKYEHKQVSGKDTLIGNVQGAYAGGLIGQAADDSAVKLENAYSAASVHGVKAADNVYTASGSANVQKAGVVYGAGEYQTGTAPFKTGKPETGSVTTGGKPYDAKLTSTYPYKSLTDMDAGLTDSPNEWITNHVGDWPNIDPLKPKIELHNEEILYVDVFLDDCDYSAANLEIKGPNETSVTIPFPFNPDTGAFDKNLIFNPATGKWESNLIIDPVTGDEKPDPTKPQRVFPKTDADGNLIKNAEGKICYRVILDDVTQENLGFGDIKSNDPNNPKNPIPLGSQIEAQAHAVSLDGRSGDSNTATCNSLFADNSSPTDAHITNFRHLENLNKLNDPSTHIDATLDNNICWTSSNPGDNPFKEGVQKIRDEYSIPSSSDPVYTPVSLNNTDFDGNNHTIKNLEVAKADDNGNAGVFGTLTGNNTIENVKLENTSVTVTDADRAGALIGSSEGGSLTVKYVESHSDKPITAKEYAGGLIGYAEGDVSIIGSASYSDKKASGSGDGQPGSVKATSKDGVAGGLIGGLVDTSGKSKVEGCAAANIVTAEGSEGVAGGLIGQAGGTVDVTYSYAGGVTTGSDPASVTGAYAGGLIGQAQNPDGTDANVTIEKSYTTATPKGSVETGGLSTGDNVTVKDPAVSYGADGLQPRKGTDNTSHGLPYDGDLLNPNNPANNPEYPYRSLGNIIAEEGPDNLPEWLKDAPALPEWVTNHVGDWPPVKGNSLPAVIWGADGVEKVSDIYTVKNDSVRYAWIDLSACDPNQPYITLSVSNLQSGSDTEIPSATKLYEFKIENDGTGNVVKPQQAGSPNATYETIGPDGASGKPGQWLRVTLDDITTSGQRFSDLFPNLNPAQEIRIHAKSSETEHSLNVSDLLNDATGPVRWDGTDKDAQKPNIASPLYDIALSKGNEAGVTNIRHLQNLDTSVSNAGARITSAKLAKDLDWNDGY